jgi:outer membrane protein W
MKNLGFILGFIFLSSISYSQEKGTQDINLSVGSLTTNQYVEIITSIFGDIYNDYNNVSYKNEKFAASFTLTYNYAIKNNWFINSNVSYQTIEKDVFESNVKTGNVTDQFITVGIGSSYHYIKKDWFQMYSGLNVAYTKHKSDSTASSNIIDADVSFFNFQLNALGFRFGKKLAATLELGFGYKGIANTGLSYQF